MVRKREVLSKPVRTIEVGRKSVSRLLDEMAQTGFQGKKLGEVAKIWTEMTRQKGLTIFMGLTGSLSTTGQWKIIRWLIEKRYIDVLVSTGANISEDLLEAIGYGYYQGTWLANDEELLRLKIDRFYDVYADEYQYRKLEDLIQKFASGLDDKLVYSTREFLWLFGEYQSKKGIRSITAAAYERKVPIYSPGLIDSGYGVALSLLKRRGKLIRLDQTKDMEELAKVAEKTRRTGVVYLGGGVPKDTIQLATVIKSLGRGGEEETPHDYAIQITADSPQWGGLSGCTLEEAVSWGKIAPDARKATLYCDITLALPIIAHAMNERVQRRVDPPDLGWVFKA
ncbi:MAG: deoxyhypusine synthase [Thaumarchaeota archaeon]|nr:MAG: deoxyhypusine synthase [Nitrososphaerota archaeon]TLY01941.1 MAG: deoxyhypusine synthase [Nitrososphaerota archaeon]